MKRTLITLITAAAAVAMPALSVHSQEEGSDGAAAATFAGGCFWCVEEAFDAVEGVISTTSGYIGGHVDDPTYEQVTAGGTGHIEAVRIEYDPSTVGYERLLEVFWRNIDPLDAGGQFCDRGRQYLSAIFYHGARQEELARESKRKLEESGALRGEIATQIVPATEFYAAEPYHQNYYEKNPVRYRFYKFSCGREARLDEVWSS